MGLSCNFDRYIWILLNSKFTSPNNVVYPRYSNRHFFSQPECCWCFIVLALCNGCVVAVVVFRVFQATARRGHLSLNYFWLFFLLVFSVCWGFLCACFLFVCKLKESKSLSIRNEKRTENCVFLSVRYQGTSAQRGRRGGRCP